MRHVAAGCKAERGQSTGTSSLCYSVLELADAEIVASCAVRSITFASCASTETSDFLFFFAPESACYIDVTNPKARSIEAFLTLQLKC